MGSPSQRVHVAMRYILRPLGSYVVAPRGPKYILYIHMDPWSFVSGMSLLEQACYSAMLVVDAIRPLGLHDTSLALGF